MSGDDQARHRSDGEEWADFADRDHRAARHLLSAAPPLLEASAFHVQQAAEKYLKALLVLHGKPVPKTHDLRHLAGLVTRQADILAGLAEPVARLTAWAISGRYPDLDDEAPSEDEIREALGILDCLATLVRAAISAP